MTLVPEMTGFAVDPCNLTVEEIEALALSAVPPGAAPPEAEGPDVMSAAPEGEGRRPQQLKLPRDVQRDRREWHRLEEIERSTEFGATFQHDSGEIESYAHWAPTALAAEEQLELDLPGYSKNHWVRRELANVLENRALVEAREQQRGVKYTLKCIDRLRRARWTGQVGYSLAKSKYVVYWDEKAGLSRLCPDDAREESQRLARRVLEPLEALQASGHALHYLVFTTPNAAPGGLRKEMASICQRFRRLILKSGEFPEIKGALCVLESPLGWARDWNVHLNVILVTRGGMHLYERLRKKWFYNVGGARRLKPGAQSIKAALTELIKYAVTATVTKSASKAAAEEAEEGGRPPPPPMLEWTGKELFEWLIAMRGFRRTRTYGCLFRLKKPEPQDLGRIIWLGSVTSDGCRHVATLPLLRSITEDKSSGLTGVAAYIAMLKGLALPGIRGAGTLGDTIERDALHRSLEQLQKM